MYHHNDFTKLNSFTTIINICKDFQLNIHNNIYMPSQVNIATQSRYH